jgi:hypothetical protein
MCVGCGHCKARDRAIFEVQPACATPSLRLLQQCYTKLAIDIGKIFSQCSYIKVGPVKTLVSEAQTPSPLSANIYPTAPVSSHMIAQPNLLLPLIEIRRDGWWCRENPTAAIPNCPESRTIFFRSSVTKVRN